MYHHTPRSPMRRASVSIHSQTAMHSMMMSTPMKRLAGVASVSCQNRTLACTMPSGR